MKINIGICEDEPVMCEYLTKLINEWSQKHSVDIEVDINVFNSSEEFLFKNSSSSVFDVLLLDIQMNKLNGMELAKKIRQDNKKTKIAFITGLKDYVFEGYEVGAIRYILKPITDEKIFELFDEIIKEKKNEPENFVVLDILGEKQRFLINDIVVITINGHYLQIVTTSNTYEQKGSLKQIREIFDRYGFVLVNRSDYVNPAHIEKITSCECTLDNGINYKVSRGQYKQVNEAFINVNNL